MAYGYIQKNYPFEPFLENHMGYVLRNPIFFFKIKAGRELTSKTLYFGIKLSLKSIMFGGHNERKSGTGLRSNKPPNISQF